MVGKRGSVSKQQPKRAQSCYCDNEDGIRGVRERVMRKKKCVVDGRLNSDGGVLFEEKRQEPAQTAHAGRSGWVWAGGILSGIRGAGNAEPPNGKRQAKTDRWEANVRRLGGVWRSLRNKGP